MNVSKPENLLIVFAVNKKNHPVRDGSIMRN